MKSTSFHRALKAFELFITSLVLLAALLHASWNAMAKSGGQPQFSIASYRLVSALCCLPFLFILPLPLPESWWPLLASVLIPACITSPCHVPISAVTCPGLSNFQGLAPVLVVLGAAFFANEHLPSGALLGIGLISLGLVSIALTEDRLAVYQKPLWAGVWSPPC